VMLANRTACRANYNSLNLRLTAAVAGLG
jgi:hypothetical protein